MASEKMSSKNKDIISDDNYLNFINMLSHDFAAPVRHVLEFSNLLAQSAKGKLEGDELTYLAFTQDAAQKINAMHAVLKDYSDMSAQQLNLSETSMTDLVEALSEQLKQTYENIDMVIDELPVISVDPKMMRRAFGYILNNAALYHSPKTSAHIHIRYEREGNLHVFEIIDNGIGIPPAKRDYVFTLFRRLHAEDAYGGGLGAGLSLAQKIIECHGGRININDNLSGGTIVTIGLPA